MDRIENHETRRHIIDAQDDLLRLIRIVTEQTAVTPFKRRAIRKAIDSIANLECALYGPDTRPVQFEGKDWLLPFLSEIDK